MRNYCATSDSFSEHYKPQDDIDSVLSNYLYANYSEQSIKNFTWVWAAAKKVTKLNSRVNFKEENINISLDFPLLFGHDSLVHLGTENCSL